MTKTLKRAAACNVNNVNVVFAVVVSQHTGCLCDAVIALLKVPLSFQRYFFQKLQSTSIKVQSLITLIRKAQRNYRCQTECKTLRIIESSQHYFLSVK